MNSSRSEAMKDNPPVATANDGKAQKDDAPTKEPAKDRAAERQGEPGPGNSLRQSPDAEGGQPVDELDLDGDGARRT
jgi:hypothetical protein